MGCSPDHVCSAQGERSLRLTRAVRCAMGRAPPPAPRATAGARMLTGMSGESSGLAGPWPVRATASVSHRLWAIRTAQGWRRSWSPDACPFQSHIPSFPPVPFPVLSCLWYTQIASKSYCMPCTRRPRSGRRPPHGWCARHKHLMTAGRGHARTQTILLRGRMWPPG
jgi:hypothetical protein